MVDCSFVACAQALRALTDAAAAGRFIKAAQRVVKVARWVLQAVGAVSLIRLRKSSILREVCRGLPIWRSALTIRLLRYWCFVQQVYVICILDHVERWLELELGVGSGHTQNALFVALHTLVI